MGAIDAAGKRHDVVSLPLSLNPLAGRAQRGTVDPVAGNHRGRSGLGDAALVALELGDEQLDAAGAEGVRMEIEAGARSVGHGDVETKIAVGLGHARTGGVHPRNDFGGMSEDDVGIIVAKPFSERGFVEFGDDERRDRADFGVIALVRGEGAFPAVLEALVLVFLQDDTGAAVAEGAQSREGEHERAVMIGTHGVERRVFDRVVGVDAGVVRPIEFCKIRRRPRRQQEHALDPAGLENGIETREGDTFAADEKGLEFEAEFTRAFLGARGERGMKARASGRAFGFVEIDGGDHAAKHLVPRTAHFGHDGADERIGPVTGGFRRGADAGGGIGSHARGAAQRF